MAVARKRAFNGRSAASQSRNAAYAAININWKQMRPELIGDESRDERLAWIAEYLELDHLASLTDLTDAQLGSVAGELKRLTGRSKPADRSQISEIRSERKPAGNVVRGDFGRVAAERGDAGDGAIVHLASEEEVYTLDKLDAYIKWAAEKRDGFLRKRFRCTNYRMLTFAQARSAVNQLLHIAAHRDLKIRHGEDKPVSRKEISRYIPILKRELRIDQTR